MRSVLYANVVAALLLGFVVNTKADWANPYITNDYDQFQLYLGTFDQGYQSYDFDITGKKARELPFTLSANGEKVSDGSIYFLPEKDLTAGPTVDPKAKEFVFEAQFKQEYTLVFSFAEELVNAFAFSVTRLDNGNYFDYTVTYFDYDGNEVGGVFEKTYKGDTTYIGVHSEDYIASVQFTWDPTPGYKENGNNKFGFTVIGAWEGPTGHAPEPATLLILGLGVAGAGVAAKRRQAKK